MTWDKLAQLEQIDKTIAALKENGINAELVANGSAAKSRVLELLPKDAEVMTMTSITLETTGIAEAINESTDYTLARNKINSLDAEKELSQRLKIGAAPDYVVGSVHAVTEDGKVVVASNTGSQLPAYAYGSQNVIWVVGTQKIVADLDAAFNRINEHVLPLESDRARKAYGVEGSYVSKLLIFNKEVNPNRIRIIFVNENLGF